MACSELAQNSAVTIYSFDFLARSQLYDSEKPSYFSGALEPKQERKRSNLTYNTNDGIELRDLRGLEHFFSLETHGFELLCHETKINLVEPSDDDLERYLEEIATFMNVKRFGREY